MFYEMSVVVEFHKSPFIFALLGPFGPFYPRLTGWLALNFRFKGKKEKKYWIGKLSYASMLGKVELYDS